MLISGITDSSYTQYNGRIVTVKHFSHGNESFQLDGVPEFPDNMKLFLGKVNNGTKAMRTGITRSNPVTVSLDDHGFENGDVVQITEMNGMNEVQNKKLIVASSTQNRFDLRWDVSSRTIYARATSGKQLVSQFSRDVVDEAVHNLQVFDTLQVIPSGQSSGETYCVNSTDSSTMFMLQQCNSNEAMDFSSECSDTCELRFSPKEDIIRSVMNHSDLASAGTNIRLETKYLHGLNDGDSIEVGALQRSDDLNYHPVRVQVLGPYVIELLNTERLQLPNLIICLQEQSIYWSET